MIMHPKEKEGEFPTKEECNTNEKRNSKASSSSRPWSRIKDPRIICVSPSFGGKDRHSKVCTIKGLRDRRVRLSMPTAIQLYDLQDRLGLNQPSKVVDWLLNAAKHEIDELPPLQIPMGNFGQYLQSIAVSHEVSAPQTSLVSLAGVNKELVKADGPHSFFLASKGGIKINNNVDGEDQRTILKSTYLSSDSRPKCKGVGNEESIEGSNTQVAQNSYYHWEPSNLSLANLGSQGYSYQTEDLHNNNIVQLPSSLSLPYASQVLVCPSTITPSFLSSPNVTIDSDPRRVNQIQMLSSTSQNFLSNSLTSSHYSITPPMRPFPLRFLPNDVASTSGFFQNDPKASF